MFKNLTNFGYERTWKEAIGFYLVYFVLGILLGFLAGAIRALITGDNSAAGGFRVGQIMAIFYCLGLTITVGYFKGILSSFKVILLIVISGVISVFIGSLGGLIPVAYLSTTSNLHKNELES